MDQPFTTPMMKQYEVIKKDYEDCLLFYRMGDFYELFLEDAHIGSKVLDITLTSRSKGKDGRIPMAGVPYHAVDSYLAKLVKAGYKVAICEQMTEPNKRGIIEREVVRVVTPGTILDEKALDKKENNFIISLSFKDALFGLAIADISTGLFQVNEFEYTNLSQSLRNELGRIQPAECIISEEDYNNASILKLLRTDHQLNITCYKNWNIYAVHGKDFLKRHFNLASLENFGIEDKHTAIQACAGLLGFLKETQKEKIHHIQSIRTIDQSDHLFIDRSTMINLELFSTIREHDSRGTLISVIDQTETAMGGRMLRTWVKRPSNNKTIINQRLDGVEELLKEASVRKELVTVLATIADIERMLARLSVGIGNARDVVNLKQSLKSIFNAKKIIQTLNSDIFHTTILSISDELQFVIDDIQKTLTDDPPVSLREGGMIRKGINKKLDMFHDLVNGGKEWIAQLEIQERKRTGIGSLKVRFNKVFGFYIEISKSNVHLIPDDYMRKQTLVNGERFITAELKKQEEIILSAEEEMTKLEYTLFNDLLTRVLSYTVDIQRASSAIAITDCLVSYAQLARANNYTKPKLTTNGKINIIQGRHPVVETLLYDTQFVPNNTDLDTMTKQLHIITGPNMAGKSVYIRQVAIIVLLAHMGSFVPAEQAEISMTDRVFVRSGASDVITSGLSTFMVEMVETAYILNHATKNSLIIMDEIGRGTSTYDGISIAWAIAEFLVTHEIAPAKTLFATHYHELQDLENKYPKKIQNFHMSVIEEKEKPIFLHTLMPGGASSSFGVAVAKLAGVPPVVIENAQIILKNMEKKKHNESTTMSVSPRQNDNIHTRIKSIDIHKTTPLEALNLLAEIQNELS